MANHQHGNIVNPEASDTVKATVTDMFLTDGGFTTSDNHNALQPIEKGEFKQRVPDIEMFELITDTVDKIGVELDMDWAYL